MTVEDIARICHEANRAYCLSIGDNSHPSWDDAPEWQRESAINGVLAIQNGTVCVPSDSHYNWMSQKAADGWVYGPIKDPGKKEHPCMVSYAELPEEQQRKDALFFNIVNACR